MAGMANEPRDITRAEHIWLQPIAAPSILGLFGFAGATFMVGAYMAGWYGTAFTPAYLYPFAAIFGGLAQFTAGMWAYRARDGLATALHGLWGSFWMAYGILHVTLLVGGIQPPAASLELGFWFIVLAAITWAIVAAASARSKVMTIQLVFLAAGASAASAAYFTGSAGVRILTGWLLVISAVIAWYVSTALMMKSAFGGTKWGIGETAHVKETPPVVPGTGEPGVIRGQA